NATNRSPFPTLHLLREASIERVVEAGADADAIVARNLRTLEKLGPDGWARLMAACRADAGSARPSPGVRRAPRRACRETCRTPRLPGTGPPRDRRASAVRACSRRRTGRRPSG